MNSKRLGDLLDLARRLPGRTVIPSLHDAEDHETRKQYLQSRVREILAEMPDLKRAMLRGGDTDLKASSFFEELIEWELSGSRARLYLRSRGAPVAETTRLTPLVTVLPPQGTTSSWQRSPVPTTARPGRSW